MTTSPWLDDGFMVNARNAPRFPKHVRILAVPRYGRIAGMKRQLFLEKIFDYEIVDGIDAEKEPERLRRAMDEKGIVVGRLCKMNPRSVACAIGHLVLIPDSLPAGAETVLILEDDALIARGFRARVEGLLRQLPSE